MSRKRINILFADTLAEPMLTSKWMLDRVIEKLQLTPSPNQESTLLDKIDVSMKAGFDVTFSIVESRNMPSPEHETTAIITGVSPQATIIYPDSSIGSMNVIELSPAPTAIRGNVKNVQALDESPFIEHKKLRIIVPVDTADPEGYVERVLAERKAETGEDHTPEIEVEIPDGVKDREAYARDFLTKCGVVSGVMSLGSSLNFNEDSVITLPNPMIAAVDQVNKVAGRKRTGGWAALKKQADMLMPEVDELLLAIENRDLAKARDAIADVVVIAFGHGSVAPIPIEEDFFRVTDALHSRFDSTKELGEESLEHHISRGIKAALYETVVDGTSYWVCRTTEACVDCDGEKYSIDKFLKSKFFYEPIFSPIDFNHDI